MGAGKIKMFHVEHFTRGHMGDGGGYYIFKCTLKKSHRKVVEPIGDNDNGDMGTFMICILEDHYIVPKGDDVPSVLTIHRKV